MAGHKKEGLAVPCNAGHLILVDEGVQCSNCLQLITSRTRNRASEQQQQKDARRQLAREQWIANYTELFGEPPGLRDYRAGKLAFHELTYTAHEQAMRRVRAVMEMDPVVHDWYEIFSSENRKKRNKK